MPLPGVEEFNEKHTRKSETQRKADDAQRKANQESEREHREHRKQAPAEKRGTAYGD